MISKEILKDIIKSNEEFITSIRNEILPRQDIVFPAGVRKVKVIYGPRRSGKTFLLYDIFQKNIGRVLYLDFEDERLSALKLDALDRIRECFFELYNVILL